jgi:catechol 2,3-dioxygenase-like lactoylglutathione lyase family enzyme
MKIRCMGILALFCACLIPAVAQPPAPGEGIIGIAHIAFRVSDLDREINFLGKLGYEEAFSMTNAGKTTEVFVKINDRQFIELYPQTSPNQPLGWMHVCYEIGDLNILYKFYVSMGLQLRPVQKAAAGNLISAVDDPEGRVTEFTQYMPGSRHTLDRGQHLGVGRVSTELMGFDLPVKDGAAMKEFYNDLGFEPESVNGNIRLSAPGAPDIHIELRTWHPGAVPEFLFAVPDARRAADELKAAGVKTQRVDGLVFVHDPDNNVFVFLETR